MQGAPIDVSHYKLRVVEAPDLKMKRKMENGKVVSETPASGPGGIALYEAVLYIRANEKDDFGKKDSEEIKVTLTTPCDDIEEDDVVSVAGMTMSTFSFTTEKGKTISGVSYRAEALIKVA
ncbi:hypothetical protein [Stackebrandtia soli]|uniref:hypothetical protein n=1 Tax=Stackebrandtia soli TaxID=1892856 RepID=UPI0039EA09A1